MQDGEALFLSRAPDASLSTVYRQGPRSGILDLAFAARQGQRLPSVHSDGLLVELLNAHGGQQEALLAADQVIVATHYLRRHYNHWLRRLEGRSELPQRGDQLICSQPDGAAREAGLVNGFTYRVRRLCGGELKLDDDDGGTIRYPLSQRRFLSASLPEAGGKGDCPLDFARVVTCHKAQGGEWPSVAVVAESWPSDPAMRQRWLYTALTRAKERLAVFATARDLG